MSIVLIPVIEDEEWCCNMEKPSGSRSIRLRKETKSLAKRILSISHFWIFEILAIYPN
jgi:hypothetical protein